MCWNVAEHQININFRGAFLSWFVAERHAEDHRQKEAHLQAGTGRIHRPREDRDHLQPQRSSGPDIRSRRQLTGEPSMWHCVSVRYSPQNNLQSGTICVSLCVRRASWGSWYLIQTFYRSGSRKRGLKGPTLNCAITRWESSLSAARTFSAACCAC